MEEKYSDACRNPSFYGYSQKADTGIFLPLSYLLGSPVQNQGNCPKLFMGVNVLAWYIFQWEKVFIMQEQYNEK